MNIDKTCILITGCIKPPDDIPYLTIKDSNYRKKQYLNSLEFYFDKSCAKKIVFCENSNAEIDESIIQHAIAAGKKFEWISFMGNTSLAVKYGKGYGEGEILKYALDNSVLLNESLSFIKVTGRFKILNINDILRFLSCSKTYFDYQNKYVDTRCYVANINTFKNLLMSKYLNVNDFRGYFLEHAYYDATINEKRLVKQIPMIINIQGQSGSTGGMNSAYSFKGYYYHSFGQIIKSVKRDFSSIKAK